MLRQVELGAPAAEVCRSHGISEQTFAPPGHRVVTVLIRLNLTRGLPQVISVDNGPEFSSKAVDAGAHENGVQ